MNTNTVVNVASVPHRSPFRYPGGKTWLVPHVRKWLKSLPNRPNDFVEPFAGGGIVGLSMLFDGLTDHTTLIELDEDIAAVWRVILNGEAKKLAEQIESFEVSVDAVRSILDTAPINLLDQAFATIIRNRMQRGGIMAKGASLMKNGENGKGCFHDGILKRLSSEFSIFRRRRKASTSSQGMVLSTSKQFPARKTFAV